MIIERVGQRSADVRFCQIWKVSQLMKGKGWVVLPIATFYTILVRRTVPSERV
jgi:hypothetical protein